MNPDVPADRDLHEQNIFSRSAVFLRGAPRRVEGAACPLACPRVRLHREGHYGRAQLTQQCRVHVVT